MRKVSFVHYLLACVCMLSLMGSLRAQAGLFFRAGLHGSYAGLDSLNGVLARYNVRSGPAKPFSDIHATFGATVQLGYAGEKWLFEVVYAGRRGGSTAEAVTALGSPVQVAQVRYGAATGEVALAYRIRPSIALGLSLDFGALTTRLRQGQRPQVSTALFYKVSTDVTLGNSAFLQVDVPLDGRFFLGFRPYYHFNYILADFARLNQSLNFSSYLDDPQFILGRTGNAGLRVTAGVWLN